MNKVDLKPHPDFSENIGYYISAMEEVRAQLRDAVRDLSNEEISLKFSPETHSIGQLVLHNAEAEWWWIQVIVSEKPLNEEEAKAKAHWDVLLDADFASKNYSAEFCLNEIDRVERSDQKKAERIFRRRFEPLFCSRKDGRTKRTIQLAMDSSSFDRS